MQCLAKKVQRLQRTPSRPACAGSGAESPLRHCLAQQSKLHSLGSLRGAPMASAVAVKRNAPCGAHKNKVQPSRVFLWLVQSASCPKACLQWRSAWTLGLQTRRAPCGGSGCRLRPHAALVLAVALGPMDVKSLPCWVMTCCWLWSVWTLWSSAWLCTMRRPQLQRLEKQAAFPTTEPHVA